MFWKEAAHHWRRSWNLYDQTYCEYSTLQGPVPQITPNGTHLLGTLEIQLRHYLVLVTLELCISLRAVVGAHPAGSSSSQPSATTSQNCHLSTSLRGSLAVSIATLWSSTLESLGCCYVWLSLLVCCRIVSESMSPNRNLKDSIWLSTPWILAFISVLEVELTAVSHSCKILP